MMPVSYRVRNGHLHFGEVTTKAHSGFRRWMKTEHNLPEGEEMSCQENPKHHILGQEGEKKCRVFSFRIRTSMRG